jgi:acetyltransferase-like isoleucine patch superfamily enzyme
MLRARGFRTHVHARDLLEDPRLAEAYGFAFDGNDDATLVIEAEDPSALGELQGLIAAAGLDHPGGPDMLVVPEGAADAPHAVLNAAVSMPALRRAAEQHWSAPAPDRFQAERVEQFRRMSTCANIVGEPVRKQPVLLVGTGRIVFGREVQFGYPDSPGFLSEYAYVEAQEPGSLVEIGDNALFNNTVTLRTQGPGISIGADCLFGTHVEVLDSDFHDLHPARRRTGSARTAHVDIGRNVWLGSGTRVMKGVTIGHDTVVGAGSVVTASLPAGVIAAGNPARVVRALETD